jgi:putative membrane fusion protein
MKKFFVTVFIIAVAAMAGYGIKYVMTPVDTVDAVVTDEEKSISAKGVIVREEHVFYASIDGTVYNNVTEGTRVAKDSLIGTVYGGDIDSDVLKELHNLDKKIEKETEQGESYASDYISVENEIATRTTKILTAARENDIASIVEYKDDINSLRRGEDITRVDRLSELKNQKGELEKSIGANKSEIYTDISGVFTTYLDGLETQLNPDSVEGYTAEYIQNLAVKKHEDKSNTSVNAGDAVCKIVNNHVWYVLLPVSSDKLSKIEENTSVSVRFKNMANEKINGVISYIGDSDENGMSVVMVKCPVYFENAFSYREADVDLIFEDYTGYKVPIQAIYTDENGNYSVIGEIGKTQYKCACDILYTDTENSFVIIDSTSDAENKLSRMDRIVVGER